ncbi:MAG: FkbM family methyltransferase [Candidatus Symbiothrix sp.]|jgi:FkbM family methyltransferase|nr:FkbM family methyltransferase [Candidatus Symbiothrix sp.]
MIKSAKGFIYKSLGLENYLRILQRGYFLAYKTGLLKRNKNYSYHYFVKKLIKKGDIIIDIGANLGYYSILFAKWTGPTGKVYSVEPIQIYNKLFNEKAKKFSVIELYPYALGLEEKTIELVSSPQTGYLSTGLPHVYDAAKDGNIENQEFRFEAQMKIPSVLFKDLEKIDYIKCDIEGFEYIVLSDMKEIIRRCKPIVQVEVWQESEAKLLSMFEELGYFPYKLNKNQLVLQKENANPMPGDYIFIYKK